MDQENWRNNHVNSIFWFMVNNSMFTNTWDLDCLEIIKKIENTNYLNKKER